MQAISLKDLLEAGCHFGHKVDRWHPKANSFIFEEREGIHVIDLAKTKAGMEQAAEIIRQMALDGKAVLFLGTKRQASTIIREEATRVGAAYISQRWIGGFLTNWPEVHKNLEKIRRLTDEQTAGSWNKYPKHERVKLSRYLNKLNYLYSGVVPLTSPPSALFVVDIRKEKVAVAEAKRIGIPIIGVVDTNSDPGEVDYVIPSNDDAVGAITCVVHYIAEAYREGAESRQKNAEVAKTAAAKQTEKAAAQAAQGTAEVAKAAPAAVKPESKPEAKPATKVVAQPAVEAPKAVAKVEEKPKKKVSKKKETTN